MTAYVHDTMTLRLDASHGELKPVHTAEAARGCGVGRAMLAHLLSVARDRGYHRVSLETGSMAAFAPARSLYAKAGSSHASRSAATVPARTARA